MMNGVYICGETNNILPTMTLDWLHSTLPSILENMTQKMHIMPIKLTCFTHCLPNITLLFKRQSCSGRKILKERITVLVGSNLNESERLQLLMIRESLKLWCFKKVSTLPVPSMVNKKAWMNASLCSVWIINLDKWFLQEKHKVLLIIDNSSAHPHIELKAIKLVFLFRNTISGLQSCDQGIIHTLKFTYWKQLLWKYIVAKEKYSNSALDALHILHSGWNSVIPMTIKNCSCYVGFSKILFL